MTDIDALVGEADRLRNWPHRCGGADDLIFRLAQALRETQAERDQLQEHGIHDDACESEFIDEAKAYSPCGCWYRAVDERIAARAEAAEQALREAREERDGMRAEFVRMENAWREENARLRGHAEPKRTTLVHKDLFHAVLARAEAAEAALREIAAMDGPECGHGYDGTPDYYIGIAIAADRARAALADLPESGGTDV